MASPKSTDREIYDYVLASCISLVMHLFCTNLRELPPTHLGKQQVDLLLEEAANGRL